MSRQWGCVETRRNWVRDNSKQGRFVGALTVWDNGEADMISYMKKTSHYRAGGIGMQPEMDLVTLTTGKIHFRLAKGFALLRKAGDR